MSKKGSNNRFRDDDLIKAIGSKVRELRLGKNLTQEELANECGVPSSQINRIETGKINFTISYLTKLAQALEVSRKVFVPD